MTNTSWREQVLLAEHYLAIGQTTCWFSTYGDDFDLDSLPWHLVTSVARSGSLLIGGGVEIANSAKFIAPHESGLTFDWSLDLAKYGTGGRVDLELVERVLPRLEGEPLRQFLALVSANAQAVRGAAVTWRDEAQDLIDACDAALRLIK